MRSANDPRIRLIDQYLPQPWRVFTIQLVVLFLISSLLYLPFPGSREWQRLTGLSETTSLLIGWDELAWFFWLLASPLILWLIRRYPLEDGQLRRNAGRVALGSLVIYFVVIHVRFLLHVLIDVPMNAEGNPAGAHGVYFFNIVGLLPLDALTYFVIFGVSFAVDLFFKLRTRAERTAQIELHGVKLQSDLARMELAALRSQLHPHFLFNTFNAVATLVRLKKNDTAVEVISQLSHLLRLAIDRSLLNVVTLEEELDFTRCYLDLEQVRFAEKLRVEFSVEPAALEAAVPNVLLQPLVENSVKHGISLRTTPGSVRVAVRRSGGRLRIEIFNDGPEIPRPADAATPAPRPGIGLANVRAQLDRHYGTDYRLTLASLPTGGTTVSLDLPWRVKTQTS